MLKINDIFEKEYLVSEKVYKEFMDIFSDKNPMHIDKSFAMSKGYKDVIMHGNILNGFISHFVGECLPIKDVIIQSQSINFIHPVYLGDKLLLAAKVSHISDAVNSVEIDYYFLNKQNVKVAKGKIMIGLLA